MGLDCKKVDDFQRLSEACTHRVKGVWLLMMRWINQLLGQFGAEAIAARQN
jgi:hypothetical protein